ncbi:hypothetical protein AB0I28_32430 [Phytomonospora sp. NPDC050363]|uniref:hypothetical protein n=1 Tax=Phytomonospora sp. NPDC050363 TaxID=3155642 RepID=UPI0033C90758
MNTALRAALAAAEPFRPTGSNEDWWRVQAALASVFGRGLAHRFTLTPDDERRPDTWTCQLDIDGEALTLTWYSDDPDIDNLYLDRACAACGVTLTWDLTGYGIDLMTAFDGRWDPANPDHPEHRCGAQYPPVTLTDGERDLIALLKAHEQAPVDRDLRLAQDAARNRLGDDLADRIAWQPATDRPDLPDGIRYTGRLVHGGSAFDFATTGHGSLRMLRACACGTPTWWYLDSPSALAEILTGAPCHHQRQP